MNYISRLLKLFIFISLGICPISLPAQASFSSDKDTDTSLGKRGREEEQEAPPKRLCLQTANDTKKLIIEKDFLKNFFNEYIPIHEDKDSDAVYGSLLTHLLSKIYHKKTDLSLEAIESFEMEYLTMSRTALIYLEKLSLPNLTELKIEGIICDDWKKFFEIISYLSQLKVISINWTSNQSLKSLEGLDFNRLQSLKELEFSEVGLKEIGTLGEVSLPNLKVLNLRSNNISSLKPLKSWKVPKLLELDLAGNDFEKLSIKTLTQMGFTALKNLLIDDSNLRDIKSFTYFGFNSLRKLSIAGDSLTNEAVAELSLISNIQGIKEIILYDQVQLNSETFIALTDAFPNLETLYIPACSVSMISIPYFEAFKDTHPSLKVDLTHLPVA